MPALPVELWPCISAHLEDARDIESLEVALAGLGAVPALWQHLEAPLRRVLPEQARASVPPLSVLLECGFEEPLLASLTSWQQVEVLRASVGLPRGSRPIAQLLPSWGAWALRAALPAGALESSTLCGRLRPDAAARCALRNLAWATEAARHSDSDAPKAQGRRTVHDATRAVLELARSSTTSELDASGALELQIAPTLPLPVRMYLWRQLPEASALQGSLAQSLLCDDVVVQSGADFALACAGSDVAAQVATHARLHRAQHLSTLEGALLMPSTHRLLRDVVRLADEVMRPPRGAPTDAPELALNAIAQGVAEARARQDANVI